MLDRTQWFLAGMSIALSLQLSQPVAAAVYVGKALQTAQTNSNSVSSVTKKLYEEAEKLYKQRTPEGFRGAIANWKEALKLFRAEGNGRGEGILYFIGLAYSQLGEKQKALEYYSQSLSLARGEGSSIDEATSLTGIGLVYSQLGEKQKALEYYSQSLPLSRSVGDLQQEGITLYHIGLVYDDLGEKQKALEYYSQSLRVSQSIGDRLQEGITLNNIGLVYSQLGETQKALEYYSQSLPLRRTEGNRDGEAITLYNLAFVKRSLGNFTEALNDIEACIKIIENLRSKILTAELRSSYLATVQDYYEFYIDLLMQLHKTNPNSGYDIKASEARKRVINP